MSIILKLVRKFILLIILMNLLHIYYAYKGFILKISINFL